MAEEYAKGIKMLNDNQLAFLKKEYGVTKETLLSMDDDDIDDKIYDPLCSIEADESIAADDSELSERGKIVSDIVTILGLSIAEYEGLLDE